MATAAGGGGEGGGGGDAGGAAISQPALPWLVVPWRLADNDAQSNACKPKYNKHLGRHMTQDVSAEIQGRNTNARVSMSPHTYPTQPNHTLKYSNFRNKTSHRYITYKVEQYARLFPAHPQHNIELRISIPTHPRSV